MNSPRKSSRKKAAGKSQEYWQDCILPVFTVHNAAHSPDDSSMHIKSFLPLLLSLMLVCLSAALYADDFETGRDAYLAKDYATALKTLTPLAEQGDARAQITLALMYEKGQGVKLDIPRAMQWYEQAAEQGLPIVQHDLGVKYFSGRGIPQNYSKALSWWTRAAKQGVVESQYNLGLMYSRGLGTSQDQTEAQHWFRLAAEKGHKQAQYSLAVMYAFGHGLHKDEAKAIQWFKKAAEQDMPEAQYNLAQLYESQSDKADNRDQAIHWYRRAARLGLAQARERLEEMGLKPEVPKTTGQTNAKPTQGDGLKGSDWIRQQLPEHYTLQLASGPDQSAIIRFMNAYNLTSDGAYFAKSYASGATRYTAIYGVYSSLTEAEDALNALPESLKTSKPWIRKFGIIQKQIQP